MSRINANPSSQPPTDAGRVELTGQSSAARAEIAKLTAALQRNRMIGAAIGVLVERHKITPEQAFARPVAAGRTGDREPGAVPAPLCFSGQEPGGQQPEARGTGAEQRPSGLTVEVVVGPQGHARVGIVGDIDMATVDIVTAAVVGQLALGRSRLVLDLSGVSFAGASALSAFIQAQQRCLAAGGWLTLTRVPVTVIRLLRLTGLDQTLRAADRSPAPEVVTGSMPRGPGR